MKAVCLTETLVYTDELIQRHNPEEYYVHRRGTSNLAYTEGVRQ